MRSQTVELSARIATGPRGSCSTTSVPPRPSTLTARADSRYRAGDLGQATVAVIAVSLLQPSRRIHRSKRTASCLIQLRAHRHRFGVRVSTIGVRSELHSLHVVRFAGRAVGIAVTQRDDPGLSVDPRPPHSPRSFLKHQGTRPDPLMDQRLRAMPQHRSQRPPPSAQHRPRTRPSSRTPHRTTGDGYIYHRKLQQRDADVDKHDAGPVGSSPARLPLRRDNGALLTAASCTPHAALFGEGSVTGATPRSTRRRWRTPRRTASTVSCERGPSGVLCSTRNRAPERRKSGRELRRVRMARPGAMRAPTRRTRR